MGAIDDIIAQLTSNGQAVPVLPNVQPVMGSMLAPAAPQMGALVAPPRFSDFRRSDNIEDRRNEPVSNEMQLQAMLQARFPGFGQQPLTGADATTQWLNDYDYANHGNPMTDLQREAGGADIEDMAIRNKGAHLSDMAGRGH